MDHLPFQNRPFPALLEDFPLRKTAIVLLLLVVFFWALVNYITVISFSGNMDPGVLDRMRKLWAGASIFSLILIVILALWASISAGQKSKREVSPEILQLLSQRGALVGKILSEMINRLESPAFVKEGDRILFKNRAAEKLPTLSIAQLSRSYEIEKVELSMGNSIATLYILKDMEKIRQEIKQQEEAKRLISLGEMASFLSHEVKNSLSVILTLAKSGRSEEIPGEVDNLARLVDEFLQEARPLNPVLREVSLGREFFSRWSVELEGEGKVRADPYLLQMVFENLLRNSSQAGAQTVKIKIRREGDNVFLEYTDDGKGIPHGEEELIFLPFYSRRKGGTGIGLSFVKKALLSMGGDIRAEAREGGAKFLIRLPAS